jgi:LuxR family maltose regulon positive regulatory protein
VATRSLDVVVPHAAQQELMLATALVQSELGRTDTARAAIDELRSAHVGTYHSLRAMGEVEVALTLVVDDRLADAAVVLEQLGDMSSFALLGPRVHDAVDRAWTELHLAAGELVEARRAAKRMRAGFWTDVTRAKVYLIEDEWQTAAEILDSLTATSPRQQVTLMLLRAQAHDDTGFAPHLDLIEQALSIAAVEGMMQTVVNAVRVDRDMLEPASAVASDEWMSTIRQRLARRGAGAPGRIADVYEQPTERERVVARYLPSRLTVPEIADAMGVTPNTLKSHMKSLYRKLDVTSREEAVTKSRRLGLIA